MSDYEEVYTITDWYDGARAGVADLNGKPYYYENRWDENKQDWDEFYLLTPLDAEAFKFALEDWEIWLRWEKAFKEGRTTNDTHPALPEDKKRHEELEQILEIWLKIQPDVSMKAKAEFLYGTTTKVRWYLEEF